MITRKFFILIFFSLIALTQLNKYYKQNQFADNIISQQKNYLVYYSQVTDSNINNIINYDMAILEPMHINSEQLLLLKNFGTISYAYQSIFEVELYNKEKISLLKEEDYLYINGIKQFNEEYKCYYGDIRSPNYKSVLLNSIEKNVLEKGFDGVFFDTLDDLEYYIDESVREELYKEYISFFKLLKSKYPELSIIQNRAFDLYDIGTATYLDGLMYEDFKYEKFETSEYYNDLVNKLSETSMNTNGVILALSHENPIENFELAKELNWLYYFSPPDNNYLKFEDNIYNVDLK